MNRLFINLQIGVADECISGIGKITAKRAVGEYPKYAAVQKQ